MKEGDITAEIKWVKLTTDMFDNRKIKQIRHLPEGNNIVLIWVMLLTIAGRCNAAGMIFLTENIPYTIESLAIELDFDQTVVRLALDILQKFGMIVCDENAFFICGWEEHQNIEGMEKIREQNRLRKQAQREREKHLLSENPTVSRDSHVMSQQSHATDIDKEKDIRNKSKNIYEEFAGGNSDLLNALKEFDSYRKLRKKPLTDNAKGRLISKLKKFPEDQWIPILFQSIDQGWSDIYELKTNFQSQKKPLKTGMGTPEERHENRPFQPTEF